MPFLRFSRDKRGYEHTYLVHAANRRGRPTRPRVLYWYRTPPGIRVGRAPFDAEMRKMLESQYPGVTFDWKTFQSTPMPPPEPEYWRERRRAERAAKQARQLEESPAGESEAPNDEATESPRSHASAQSAEVAVESSGSPQPAVVDGSTSGFDRRVAASGPNPNQPERRRSRRGGRRQRARMAMAQGGDGARPTGAPAAVESATTQAAAEGASEKLDEASGTPASPGESGQE